MEEDLLAQIFAIAGQRFSPLSLSRAQFMTGLLDAEGSVLRSPSEPHF